MKQDDLPLWLLPTWERWRSAKKKDALPQAVLITANEGVLSDDFVDRLTKVALCTNAEQSPCGQCHSCQLVQTGNHPDLHKIAPESAGKQISIDAVRRCQRFTQESSQLGGARVILIEQSESMNEASSNALLKMLESSPPNCFFLLTSHFFHELLPTIVSRCERWQVMPPQKEQLITWLAKRGIKAPKAEDFELNANAPFAIERFCRDNQWEMVTSLDLTLSDYIQGAEPLELQKIVSIITNKSPEQMIEKLHWLWHLLLDAQRISFGVPKLEALLSPQVLADHFPYDHLLKQSQRLQAMSALLRKNPGLNADILLADWFLSLFSYKNSIMV